MTFQGSRVYAGWLAGCLLLLAGCTRQEEVTYSTRAEVKELPAPYQQQISQALNVHFGTASDPLCRVSDFDAEPNAEGEYPLVDQIDSEQLARGKEVYNRRCAGCHGITGDGAGVAAEYLYPQPRDYRLGFFKFTSTPYGKKPRRTDLVRILRYGAKGTSMPAFRWLADEELQAVIDYVIMLSQRGEVEYLMFREAELLVDPEAKDDEQELLDPEAIPEIVADVSASWEEAESSAVIPLTPEPPMTEESIAIGQQIFQDKACKGCHKVDAAGGLLAYEQLLQNAKPEDFPPELREHADQLSRDLMSPQLMKKLREEIGSDALPDSVMDNWGNFSYAANLTSGMLHGGRRPIDIYRRVFTGVTGTPMPSFAQHELFTQDPDNFWHVVHFVIATTEGRPVPTPATPSDEATEPTEPAAGSDDDGGQPDPVAPDAPTNEPATNEPATDAGTTPEAGATPEAPEAGGTPAEPEPADGGTNPDGSATPTSGNAEPSGNAGPSGDSGSDTSSPAGTG